MAKGNDAKNWVTEKIKEAVGENFIVEQDKKIYVWAPEGGEKIQVAISLTCPKTPLEVGAPKPAVLNFEDTGITTSIQTPAPAEITEKEKVAVQELLARLGL